MTAPPLTYTAGLEIDADGSPRAYAPLHSGLATFDWLANAGSPGNWYGLACDASGQPYIQTANDPAPGYYVSTTALQDHSKAVSDPRRYVDSENVPYVVIPRGFPAHLGDLCRVEYNTHVVTSIVADIGPRNKYGEGSICLAKLLGINSDPKHGGISSGVTYYIYANTTQGWFRTWADVDAQMQQLLKGNP